MLNTLAQPYEALAFLYAGCILGALTTTLCILRLFLRSIWALHAFDAVYALVCALVFAAVCYVAINGRLRLFALLIMLLGAALFYLLVGKRALRFAQKRRGKREQG